MDDVMACPDVRCGSQYFHVRRSVMLPACALGQEQEYVAIGANGRMSRHGHPQDIPPIPWERSEQQQARFLLDGYCGTCGKNGAIGFCNIGGQTLIRTASW